MAEPLWSLKETPVFVLLFSVHSDSVSAAIFSVLLDFVFSPRMCLPLSIHNAMTSIKLWHFSQITWAAISCFNMVTPKSIWVKDTICDLSIKSVLMWYLFAREEGKTIGRTIGPFFFRCKAKYFRMWNCKKYEGFKLHAQSHLLYSLEICVYFTLALHFYVELTMDSSKNKKQNRNPNHIWVNKCPCSICHIALLPVTWHPQCSSTSDGGRICFNVLYASSSLCYPSVLASSREEKHIYTKCYRREKWLYQTFLALFLTQGLPPCLYLLCHPFGYYPKLIVKKLLQSLGKPKLSCILLCILCMNCVHKMLKVGKETHPNPPTFLP